jgi:predicted alpha/beta-fold hydrolase
MTDLTRDDMIEGLRELVRELHARGEAGGVRIVGGAAMLLRYYGERRVTPDIDAKLHPEAPAIRIAEDIADGTTTG